MNKLEFLLKNNDDVIYNDEVLYIKNDNDILFTHNNVNYIVRYSNNSLYFMRETEEEIFVIDAKDRGYESYVELKKDNLKFDLIYDNFNFNNGENEIDIIYSIKGDEEVLRNIKIRLI